MRELVDRVILRAGVFVCVWARGGGVAMAIYRVLLMPALMVAEEEK